MRLPSIHQLPFSTGTQVAKMIAAWGVDAVMALGGGAAAAAAVAGSGS
jgi:hypothetical protein